ncbi:MAG: peptide chain release factor N(5)-glutamine methyltransferase [Thermoanaerobaculia bacterium]
MNIRELRQRYRREALREGVSPRDVDLLLGDALEVSLVHLVSHDEETIENEALRRFTGWIERRFDGEPLQYIRGRCEFFGREFLVDPRVLIPRPETEILVEAALDRAPAGARVLDVGTGSGEIALTLAAERADLITFASDVSVGALAMARRNASRIGTTTRFVASDVLASIRGRFELIVSNPPYVNAEAIESLQREVRDHEPRVALTPGGNGLQVIESLFSDSKEHLRPGGFLIMEIGFDQAAAVQRLAENCGWRIDTILDDLAGIPRIVVSSLVEPQSD